MLPWAGASSEIVLAGARGLLEAKVIVNPRAGAGGTARKWPDIMRCLHADGLEFDYELTQAPGHARELAAAAARDGYGLVVSVGGDGTINEAVNGLYDAGKLAAIPLGIVCTGTGADYIRSAGIPHECEQACFRLTHGASPRAVDVGVLECLVAGRPQPRLFVNFAGIGFDGEVVKRTSITYKRLGRRGSYLTALLTTLAGWSNRRATFTMDGQREERRVCLVMVCNGRYGGGGMFPAPEASIQDGLLDVMVVGDVGKFELLRTLSRVYDGTHVTHPKVAMRRVREALVEMVGPTYVHADGDLAGMAPAKVRLMQGALRIMV